MTLVIGVAVSLGGSRSQVVLVSVIESDRVLVARVSADNNLRNGPVGFTVVLNLEIWLTQFAFVCSRSIRVIRFVAFPVSRGHGFAFWRKRMVADRRRERFALGMLLWLQPFGFGSSPSEPAVGQCVAGVSSPYAHNILLKTPIKPISLRYLQEMMAMRTKFYYPHLMLQAVGFWGKWIG